MGQNFIAGVISPMVIYLAILAVLPIVWAIVLAFFEYSPRNAGGPILGFGGDNPFVGLQHFRDMIEGGTREARIFHLSLRNTLVFAIAILPVNLLITLPLAAMIESTQGRIKTIFRAIYFLPVVTSSVGVAIMWQFIYNPQYGLANSVIKAFGGQPIVWLHDPTAEFLGISVALWAVIIAYVWQDYGYNLVILIAAMQTIPETLKEAARVDGANPFQIFRYVTLPLLRPTLLLVCILTMISSFQVFDIIQVMTQGGPGRLGLTRVLVLDIYENAFQFEQMGWAAAIALVLFVLVLIVTAVQMRVLRSDWEY
ncbi:carbohydrate ABC transporter permease [Chloroflexota bacterium]